MKTLTKKTGLAVLTAGAVLSLGLGAIFAGELQTTKASAAENVSAIGASDYQFAGYSLKFDEASVNTADSGKSAFRFKMTMSDTVQAKIGTDITETGTLIYPNHYLGGSELTVDSKAGTNNDILPIKVDTTNAWSLQEGSTNVYENVVYLNEIPAEYYSTKIAVRGYAKSGDTYYYTTATTAQSFAWVVNEEYNDEDSPIAEDKTAFREAFNKFSVTIDGTATQMYYGEKLTAPTTPGFVAYTSTNGEHTWDLNTEITGPVWLKTKTESVAAYDMVVPYAAGDVLAIDGIDNADITAIKDADGNSVAFSGGVLTDIAANTKNNEVDSHIYTVKVSGQDDTVIKLNVYGHVIYDTEDFVDFFLGKPTVVDGKITGYTAYTFATKPDHPFLPAFDDNDKTDEETPHVFYKTVALATDIDLVTEGLAFTRSAHAGIFDGLFDGLGHTIKYQTNLKKYSGLFAYKFEGTLTNVALDIVATETGAGAPLLALYANGKDAKINIDNVAIKLSWSGQTGIADRNALFQNIYDDTLITFNDFIHVDTCADKQSAAPTVVSFNVKSSEDFATNASLAYTTVDGYNKVNNITSNNAYAIAIDALTAHTLIYASTARTYTETNKTKATTASALYIAGFYESGFTNAKTNVAKVGNWKITYGDAIGDTTFTYVK